MEERNANNPNGEDRGPRRVVRSIYEESALTAVPSSFSGGADGTSSRDAFQRNAFANKPKLDKIKV